ncbi:hypothetical protein QO002_006189 [Pararhizobium capsulatum DSM 1112]|uniref:DUF1843 domain-containing protein n=1 Tax=Pararhizobium capsulatum DSM 1112 TaxID=1121113 RepID=A0ABU0C0C7_9HYPH|nr:hypothetical protein [Pararhizobium capsulatum]MDQ0323982.1 hypothetical protein [Pararhizobium capsulatum DSM 1112]
MAEPKMTAAEMMQVVVHMNLAHNAAIVCLVKALEDSGMLKVGRYEELLRRTSAGIVAKGDPGAASLIDELADAVKLLKGSTH